MYKWIVLIALNFVVVAFKAQLPETDLWLFKIKQDKDKLTLGEGKNITSRKGYDNQPVFRLDGKQILYVSIREDNQADVYAYEISKQQSIQVTKTKESEYSSNYTPDGNLISCVVVEQDSTQRLWLYNLDGSVKKCYAENIDSIGYYTLLTWDTLLYYKLTDPHSLHMFVKTTGEDVWICNSPSRAFKKTSGNKFIYAIKDSSSIQYRIYDPVIQKSELYASHKSRNEDFVWNELFGLLKSEGKQILRYDEKLSAWLTWLDFSTVGIKKITRFALDSKSKQIVLVDNN